MEIMMERDGLAETFEAHRNHLRAAAYRMLGSLSEAEDAVQECWLRFSRSDTSGVDNLGGWLTTVVSRVCLDMLRARRSRREESLEAQPPGAMAKAGEGSGDPEQEALLADTVGLALLVVLDRLSPAERVAFVLHDAFALPFSEIASVLGRTEAAARQLASRARRRMRSRSERIDSDLARQLELVEAFLAAAHAGDFNALLSVLDPDVVLRDDRRGGAPVTSRGAEALAKQVAGRAQAAEAALVDGSVGIVAAPRGRLLYILRMTVRDGKIAEVDLISEPSRISRLDLTALVD